MSEKPTPDYIFNSALETGIRSLCVLSVDDTMQYDLQQLCAFDHLVVHTGDMVNAPSSLHPNVLQRNGEILIRRSMVEQGLLLMESKRLVERVVLATGFFYSATELAVVFINSLENEYVAELNKRSSWVVEKFKSSGDNFFTDVFNTAFDRWTREFQISEVSIGEA